MIVCRSGARCRLLGGQTVDKVLGIDGRLGRMTCPPAWTDSDGVKAVYLAHGNRAAVDASAQRAGLRTVRAGLRGARSTPRAGGTLIAYMWTRRRRQLGGERQLVGVPLYRAWIDGWG
jgi:hypothetical protein